MMQYQEAYNRLEQYGQTHLLRYYDTLSAAEQAALLQQISEMDFSTNHGATSTIFFRYPILLRDVFALFLSKS